MQPDHVRVALERVVLRPCIMQNIETCFDQLIFNFICLFNFNSFILILITFMNLNSFSSKAPGWVFVQPCHIRVALEHVVLQTCAAKQKDLF